MRQYDSSRNNKNDGCNGATITAPIDNDGINGRYWWKSYHYGNQSCHDYINVMFYLSSFDNSSMTFSRFSSKALSFFFCAPATIYVITGKLEKLI